MTWQRVWFAIEAKSFELTVDGKGEDREMSLQKGAEAWLNGYALEKKGCVRY